MNGKRLVVCGAMFALLFGCGSIYAVPFTGSAVGSWVNPSGDAFGTWTINNSDNAAPLGVAMVSWGIALDHQSDLKFNGQGTVGNTTPWSSASNPFAVGSLTFDNGQTLDGSNLTGIDLDVLVQVFGALPSPLGTFDCGLTIQNTINPSPDSVLFVSINPATYGFSADGVDYTFTLNGFSADGGATILSQFSVPEDGSQTIALYGSISPTGSLVPDAGNTLILLGSTLLSLVAIGRCQARAMAARSHAVK